MCVAQVLFCQATNSPSSTMSRYSKSLPRGLSSVSAAAAAAKDPESGLPAGSGDLDAYARRRSVSMGTPNSRVGLLRLMSRATDLGSRNIRYGPMHMVLTNQKGVAKRKICSSKNRFS